MKQETNDLLRQIRNILIVIAIILVVNVIVTAISSNNRTYSSTGDGTSTDTNTGTKSQGGDTATDYDVSAFMEVTVDEMFTKVNTSGYQIVYIGRSGCGYCRMFLPTLKEAQKNFHYTTLYIDLTKVTNDGATKMKGISDKVKEKWGYTPMVIVYKDGVYQDMWLGYDEYSSFESYLLGLGMSK